jgi:hypothetical protein
MANLNRYGARPKALHFGSDVERPELPRSARVDDMRHSAALTSLPAAEDILHTSGERKRRQDGDIDVTNRSTCYAEREVREGGAR